MAILLFIFIPKVLSHREEITMKLKKKGFRNSMQYGVTVSARTKEVFNVERDLRGSCASQKNVEMYGDRLMKYQEEAGEEIFPIKPIGNLSTKEKVIDTISDNDESNFLSANINDTALVEEFPEVSDARKLFL